MEQANINIRIEKSLRDAFTKICQDQDTTASREIRAFIREFVKKNKQTTCR